MQISKVADTLVSQSTMNGCNLKKAWDYTMPSSMTESFSFEEVKAYIDRKIQLAEALCMDASERSEESHMDTFIYCSECGEPLTDDDTVYEDLCDECGNDEQIGVS